MSTADIISLAVTIGLGVLSLGLGVFAIWLSGRFEQRASAALRSIEQLTNETRILTDVSVSHQKDFSGKMLESILTDRYGVALRPDLSREAIELALRNSLMESEHRMLTKLEAEVLKVAGTATEGSMRRVVETIRSETARLVEVAAASASEAVGATDSLRMELLKYKDLPAHYLTLAAIVRERGRSASDLLAVQDKYALGPYPERGVANLLGTVLEGASESFVIKAAYREPLERWVTANWPVLAKMVTYFDSDELLADTAAGYPKLRVLTGSLRL